MVYPYSMKFPMIEENMNNLKPEGSIKVTFEDTFGADKTMYSIQVKVKSLDLTLEKKF